MRMVSILLLLLLLLCSACTAGRLPPAPGAALPAAPPQEAGPPEYMERETSVVTIEVPGSAVHDSSGMEPSGSAAILDGGTGTPASFVLYRLSGLSGASFFSLTLHQEVTTGGPLYLGLPAQGSRRWEWSAIPAGSAPQLGGFELDGRLTEAGSLYFAVACHEGCRAILLEVEAQVGYPGDTMRGRDFLWHPERRAAIAASQQPDMLAIKASSISNANRAKGLEIPADGQWSSEAASVVMSLGCAWQLTGEESWISELQRWLGHIATYENFQGGRPAAADLDAGLLLLSVSVALEWTEGRLDPVLETRLRYLATIEAETQSAMLAERADRFFWNHAHYQAVAIYAAGCALEGQDARATGWRDQGASLFEGMEQLLDASGGACYPEGAAYASAVYGLCALYREMRRSISGSAPVHGWWSQLDEYYAHTLRPDGRATIRLADDDGDWFWHPAATLRHAALQASDPGAQALAIQLRDLGGTSGGDFDSFTWQELVLADPRLGAAAALRPASHVFDDFGLAVERDDWGADAGLLAVRAGLPGGGVYNAHLKANPASAYGGLGHVQADLSSLQWWAGATCLLADPGFESIKLTSQHNALTLSGRGQMGEAAEWWGWGWDWKPWGYGARIDFFGSPVDGLTLASMTADTAYVPAAHVQKHRRKVLWLKPNVLLVADQVLVTQAKDIEANWVTQIGSWTVDPAQGQAGSASRLNLRPIGVQPSSWQAESVNHSPTGQLQRLRTVFPAPAGETRIAHIFWDSAQTGWQPIARFPDRVAFSWPQKSWRMLNVHVDAEGSVIISGEIDFTEQW